MGALTPARRLPPAQHPHDERTPPRRGVRPVCALRAHPLSRLPAKTPSGGLPPLFPTSPPPQGDPEGEVGNSPGKRRQAGQRERGETTRAPGPHRTVPSWFLPRTPHPSTSVPPPRCRGDRRAPGTAGTCQRHRPGVTPGRPAGAEPASGMGRATGLRPVPGETTGAPFPSAPGFPGGLPRTPFLTPPGPPEAPAQPAHSPRGTGEIHFPGTPERAGRNRGTGTNWLHAEQPVTGLMPQPPSACEVLS